MAGSGFPMDSPRGIAREVFPQSVRLATQPLETLGQAAEGAAMGEEEQAANFPLPTYLGIDPHTLRGEELPLAPGKPPRAEDTGQEGARFMLAATPGTEGVVPTVTARGRHPRLGTLGHVVESWSEGLS